MKRVLFSLMMITLISSSADAQLSKLFKKKKKKEEKKELAPIQTAPYPGDFSDENNWSGVYYSKDTLWYGRVGYENPIVQPKAKKSKNAEDRYEFTNEVKFKFQKMKDGNVVNEMTQYTSATNSDYGLDGPYLLNEKYKNNYDVVFFYKRNYNDVYLQIEPGVILWCEARISDDFKIEEVKALYVKDKSKLDVWNEEIALAKVEQMAMEVNKKKTELAKAKYMKMPTYKAMKGKVGFVDAYHKLTYNRIDEIKEKPETFMSSIELGKTSIFYKAFYETPGNTLCPGCEWNVTYEIGNVKVGRVQQRRESAAWSRMIKQKFVDDNFFTFVPPMINYQRNIADYAFLKALYENKDKLKNGAKIPVKVTISTCRDGVDQDILATGTLTLIIKDSNRDGIDKALGWYEDFISE